MAARRKLAQGWAGAPLSALDLAGVEVDVKKFCLL
jgi:hypothetical protein